jgi:hypothetical protein
MVCLPENDAGWMMEHLGNPCGLRAVEWGAASRFGSGDLGVIRIATATIENDNGFKRDELVRATQRTSEDEGRAPQRKQAR